MFDTYYGGFRNALFLEVFPDYAAFEEARDLVALPDRLASADTLKTIYTLLCARYGESVIAYNSIHLFKQAIFSTIFSHAPAWEKRIELQDRLRELTQDQIARSTRAVHNHSYNDGTPPGTGADELLPTTDAQNTSTFYRGELDGIRDVWALLDVDATEDFLNEFRPHFIAIVAPSHPLLYNVSQLDKNIEEV